MKKKTILISGGAGFIASHVADAYLKKGLRVVVVDNLSSGFKKNVPKRATFYKTDLRNAAQIERICMKERPMVINHHAAVVEVVKSVRDPIPTYESNILGTVNLLLAGGKSGIKKFIFSSTGGAIYGEPKKIPASETTTVNPLSPYGLSKQVAELMIQFYAREYGFTYLIFRYSNIYGPRQNPKGEAGVVAIFGALMKQGGQPIIFGDGSKKRDYVFVEDIAHANLLALARGKNEIVNIGWGKKISDKMMFDTIAEELKYKKPPHYKPFRKGEVYEIALDAQKAKKVLGWRPKVLLKDGIARTLKTL